MFRMKTKAAAAAVMVWAATAAAAGQLVLSEGGAWRAFFTWRAPMVREEDGTLREAAGPQMAYVGETPPPPDGWTAPDFDDRSWSRLHLYRSAANDYGFGAWAHPTLSTLCLRGRFQVGDPARAAGLTLSLSYRGGVIVYLNGRQIARAGLPEDSPAGAGAFAEDYPPEAFLSAKPEGGRQYIWSRAIDGNGKLTQDAEGLARRIRELKDVPIDPAALRKGVNVLAVEIHRSPYFGNGLEKQGEGLSPWATCGLVGLQLRAAAGVTPSVARPGGVRVWVESVTHRSTPADWADPLETPSPLCIVGCRAGSFTGKVVVGSDSALEGVRAELGELRHKDGRGVVAGSQIDILYCVNDNTLNPHARGGYWDTLLASPPAKVEAVAFSRGEGPAAIQPVVVKVHVPADAAPGEYRGTLAVSAAGARAVELPVELRVVDWQLPAPKDFVTHMGIIESPESVAMRYEVPLWSERHWKCLESSFRLLGEVGNKEVVLPLICRTNFGNSESMVRWIRDGDGWKFDFTVFDRYLDLALKYQKPDVICLYIWEPYTGRHTWTNKDDEGKPPLVTCWDREADKVEEISAPRCQSPEGRKAWGALLRELRERVEQRGMGDALMLGINSEWCQPIKELGAALREIAPKCKWVANGHRDYRGQKVCGFDVGYSTAVYIGLLPPPGTMWAWPAPKEGRFFGWQSKTDVFPRANGPATRNPLYPSSHLAVDRITMEAALVTNCSGLGRVGADFWPVLVEGKDVRLGRYKPSLSLSNRYQESGWAQLSLDFATESFLAPGPEGAVTTERFEQVREGVQDCEARIFIEKAVLSGKLDAEMVRKCWQVLDERQWRIHAACSGNWSYWEGAGSAGLAEKLYACAAEAAGRLRP